MKDFRHLIIVFVSCLLINKAGAGNSEQNFYRNFWNPTYHIQRLNYCTVDGKICGLGVATRYCQMMGYNKADQQIIDYNVGLTNYLLSRVMCKGWECNGFMLIRCVDKMSHTPPKNYYYRSAKFVFPRFGNYRVDWCYKEGHGCGQKVAYSFCRRMGYMKAQHYKKEPHVSATKALGNQKLCFGNECSGFSSISCYR